MWEMRHDHFDHGDCGYDVKMLYTISDIFQVPCYNKQQTGRLVVLNSHASIYCLKTVVRATVSICGLL